MKLQAILGILLFSAFLRGQETIKLPQTGLPKSDPLQGVVRGDLRLMWYNVENLFHPSQSDIPSQSDLPSQTAPDNEFTPEGVRAWTYNRYRDKLTRLARVIVAAGQWEPPDVIGLCEVEGALVLEDLVAHPILLPYNYSYLHHEGPDHRGMDVACLFRGEHFNPVSRAYISPPVGDGMDQTREMIHLKGAWGRRDTLELFLVHFISRYRGSGITANYRRKQSGRLAELIDSVHCHAPSSLVVAAGDFNDIPHSWSMEPLVSRQPGGDSLTILNTGESYKYRGVWSAIDFILVGGLRDAYRIRSLVFRHPELLIPDQSYGGLKPFRTYDGYSYIGGYSDHLPLIMDVSRNFRPHVIGE